MGATTSSIRGFASAIYATEDLEWNPLAVTTLHKRIAAGPASAGTQPYLPPAGVVILVEKATKSKYGPLLGAFATLAWICFLRVGEVATIRVADIALPAAIQFWNSKTGDEGVTTKPLSRYADQGREWAHGFVVLSSKKSDMLVWQASKSALELGMAECIGGVHQGQVARPPPGRRGGVRGPQTRRDLLQMVGAVVEHCEPSFIVHDPQYRNHRQKASPSPQTQLIFARGGGGYKE